MWLIWPAPGSVGRAARNLEILREPELIKPHLSRGPDHWSVRGRREKLAIKLAGGWPLREILDNFRQLSVDWNATIKSKLFPFTSGPVMMRDFNYWLPKQLAADNLFHSIIKKQRQIIVPPSPARGAIDIWTNWMLAPIRWSLIYFE